MFAAASLALLLAAPPQKLQFLDVVAGTGADKIEKGDVVSIGYRGWIYSTGTEFDSSKTKAPASFKVGEGSVLKAWNEGLLGAIAGTRRVILAPPAFAYGDKISGSIPADSTLGFEVDVLRVDKKNSKSVIEIQELRSGDGPESKDGDMVSLHYTGTFLNGVKFDSSRDRNQPFQVILGEGRVIKGFEQGLRGMKAGQRRKVTIPYSLGYGEKGAGGVIPPFATIVFDLELLEIKKS